MIASHGFLVSPRRHNATVSDRKSEFKPRGIAWTQAAIPSTGAVRRSVLWPNRGAGQFQATRSVQVEAAALLAFAEALSQLLDDLSGAATLEPVLGYNGHGNFALTVTLENGKGDVAGFLATHLHDTRLTFGGVEIDQSYLQGTHHQLRSLLAEQ